MDRVACVDVPALPLQGLLRRHGDWAQGPAAVVDRDAPAGVIEWVNEGARARRILPGMRYGTALALSRELRAGVVLEEDVVEEVRTLAQRLGRFSPRIEPSFKEPGVFWVDASGLGRLYPSLEKWAGCIEKDFGKAGFRCVVAVGFSRFGSYGAAKAHRRRIVFENAEEERAFLRDVPVDRLRVNPQLRDILSKLGVNALGGFMDLPGEGILRRFGAEAYALHQMAAGKGWDTFLPYPLREPVERRVLLDYPERQSDRLVASMAPLAREIVTELWAYHEGLTALWFSLTLDDGNREEQRVAPSAPTRDAEQIISLVRLRMERLVLPAGVVELTVRGVGVRVTPRQLDLFRETPRRTLEAAQRAFAKVCAELGNDAVVCAQLQDGHLPEACFSWAPLQELAAPAPETVSEGPLVRRIFARPVALPSHGRHEPDGWLIAGLADGPVEEVIGPHLVSGGWWKREVTRAYYFVRTASGRWLWVYHDHHRRQWFLHGEVE